jgi:hypothetical protein
LVSNLQTLLIVSGKLPRQINDDSPAGVALVGLPLFHIGTIQMDMDYFTSSQVVSTVPSTLQSLTSGSSALSTLLSTPVSQALEPLFGAAGADAPYLFGPLVVGRSSESLVSPLFALVGEAPAAAASDASAVPEGGLGTLVGSYGSEARGAGVSRPRSVRCPCRSPGGPRPRRSGLPPPDCRVAAWTVYRRRGRLGPGGWFSGPPPVGSALNAPRNGAAGPRTESRLKVIPQMAGATGVRQGTPDRGIKPNGHASDASRALSERERDELDELRTQIAELTMQALAAPTAVTLFSVYDCTPQSDCAAMLLRVAEDVVDRFNDRPVWIRGVGLGLDSVMHQHKSDMPMFAASVRAAKQAFTMAGLTPSDVHVAEVHDFFTSIELMSYEDLGFAERFGLGSSSRRRRRVISRSSQGVGSRLLAPRASGAHQRRPRLGSSRCGHRPWPSGSPACVNRFPARAKITGLSIGWATHRDRRRPIRWSRRRGESLEKGVRVMETHLKLFDLQARRLQLRSPCW